MAKCIQAILIASLFLVIPSVLASEKENIIALPSEQKVCNKNYESVSCPVSCFRADPVCGVNGITYWCGCAEALCADVEVAKVGFCPVGSNGGSGLLTGQALLLVMVATLLFIIPSRKSMGEKLMDWNKCKKLSWNNIFLLGASTTFVAK